MVRLKRLLFLVFLALTTLSLPSLAVEPDEVLDDPALEARARDLGQILRCLVCQNQSIDDSNAPLARDLRVLVRERLKAGDTNEEAIDYIVARYGNFVLLKPPVQVNTLALWFGPAIIFLIALIAFRMLIRRRASTATTPDALTKAEREELQTILEKGRAS